MKRFFSNVFDFFTSLKLAVILILSLGVVLAVGTFYEAEYGTPAAHRVVYQSIYVSVLMILLITNLAAAAIDRYPWKKHHVGFVITHLGIIILIMGSFVTQQRGLDGNIALGISESTDNFFVADTELHIYQSLDGRPFALLIQKPVDFDGSPPSKTNYSFKLADDDVMKIVGYVEKGARHIEVKPSDNKASLPALKFSLRNERVDVSEWLGLDRRLPPFYDLGPASVSFIQGPLPVQPQPRNQIVVYQPDPKKPEYDYAIFSARQLKPIREGVAEENKEYPTGWMNLKFKLDQIVPHAQSDISYVPGEGENTSQAVQVEVNGNRSWFEMESPHEIKGNHTTYFVSYTRKKYELGFGLFLKKFKVGTYGGTNLPASYESTVVVDNKQERVISMNEPLKYKGYTIYQTSYETNDRGEPTTSVFTVNYDPGRSIKYAGSLGIVCGIAIMFYWKPRYTRKAKVKA